MKNCERIKVFDGVCKDYCRRTMMNNTKPQLNDIRPPVFNMRTANKNKRPLNFSTRPQTAWKGRENL